MPNDSILEGQTFGQVRRKLNLLYRMGATARPDMVFTDGQSFGEFSLRYLQAKHSQRVAHQSRAGDPGP